MVKWFSGFLFAPGFCLGGTVWPLEEFNSEPFPIGVSIVETFPAKNPDSISLVRIQCDTFYRDGSAWQVNAKAYFEKTTIEIPIAHLELGERMLAYFRFDEGKGESSARFTRLSWSPPSGKSRVFGDFSPGSIRAYERTFLFRSPAPGGSAEQQKQIWRVTLLEARTDASLRTTRWNLACKQAITLNHPLGDSVFDALAIESEWDTVLMTPIDSPIYLQAFERGNPLSNDDNRHIRSPIWIPDDHGPFLTIPSANSREGIFFDSTADLFGIQPQCPSLYANGRIEGFQYFQERAGLVFSTVSQIMMSGEDRETIRLLEYGKETIPIRNLRISRRNGQGKSLQPLIRQRGQPSFEVGGKSISPLGRNLGR